MDDGMTSLSLSHKQSGHLAFSLGVVALPPSGMVKALLDIDQE
jgi:hypothetical protein